MNLVTASYEMKTQCDYLLPTFNVLTPEKEIVPCLLLKWHDGDHVSQLSNGEYIVWLLHWLVPWDDGGDGHECDDDCEDFVYSKISSAEASERIGKNWNSEH